MAGLVDASGNVLQQGEKPKREYRPWRCVNCGQTTQFEIPVPEVINVLQYSTIHFSHENPQSCEHCGQKYVFVLGGFSQHKGFILGFQPLQDPNQQQVVRVPAGVIPNIKGGGNA